jgi:hypothetical protein
MEPFNLVMQSTSVELLQAVVSRGGGDDVSLKSIEAVVIAKLFISIHRQRLDVQPKLLHLLYSLLSATSPRDDGTTDDAPSSVEPNEGRRPPAGGLLTKALIDGVTIPTNRPVFQHWFDFIVMAMPKPSFNLTANIPVIVDNIARELRSSLDGTIKAWKDAGSFADAKSAVSEADFVMYLNALESLVLANLNDGARVRPADGESLAIDRSASESGGLFSFFTSDAGAQVVDEPSSVSHRHL